MSLRDEAIKAIAMATYGNRVGTWENLAAEQQISEASLKEDAAAALDGLIEWLRDDHNGITENHPFVSGLAILDLCDLLGGES